MRRARIGSSCRWCGGPARIRDLHGPSALAGFGSAKGSNEEAYLFQKLVRTGFGTNNVDHCTRLCHASSVAALFEGIGTAAVTAPFMAANDADVIIVIGANPTENHPVAATYFEQLKEHVADYTPDKMAAECGIAAETIRTVARLYARAEAAIIFWGMGISQSIHGTDNARCLIALSLITGQLGRPGTGLHPLRGQNNVQGASDAGLIPMFLPDYQSVENAELRGKIEQLWGAKLDPKRGLTVVEIMGAIHAGQIRGMYIMGENPAMSDPDAHHAREALAKLEHLVVQDLFLTETAFHADVVLPAAAFPEKDGTFTNTNRQVQMGRTA